MARKTTAISFDIDHMDPMGQGVSRDGKTVTFIANTLPGESGSARVYKKSRGVRFAVLDTLSRSAENRCAPQCPHFQQCPGCHYLHTDYVSELQYKRQALARHLSPLGVGDESIELVPATRRLAYRNRVQLHYRHKYIGMLDPVSNKVVEIPHCQIFRAELQPAFNKLYEDKSWCSAHPGHGHCELYVKDGEVSTQWNADYAHGGFSQVYDEMNKELQLRVQAQLTELSANTVLDLFSGRGNLSNTFSAQGGERTLVDSYWGDEDGRPPQNFVKLDLFGEHALRLFLARWRKKQFDTLLVDPPRRGFPNLDSWVKKIKPRHLLYVSCNPASLARDLRSLSAKHTVGRVQLLDFFPATYHFETLVHVCFKSGGR